jgi:hypothetical protein
VVAVLDELAAVAVELVDVCAGAVELAGDDPPAAAAVDPADDDDDEELFELEWPPDPHAATSSAVTSAATARLTIGPAYGPAWRRTGMISMQ